MWQNRPVFVWKWVLLERGRCMGLWENRGGRTGQIYGLCVFVGRTWKEALVSCAPLRSCVLWGMGFRWGGVVHMGRRGGAVRPVQTCRWVWTWVIFWEIDSGAAVRKVGDDRIWMDSHIIIIKANMSDFCANSLTCKILILCLAKIWNLCKNC